MSTTILDLITTVVIPLTNYCLAGVALLVCLACLILVFRFARGRNLYAADALKKHWEAKEAHRVLEVETKLAVVTDEIVILQEQLKEATEADEKQGVEAQLRRKQDQHQETAAELKQAQQAIAKEAKEFAQSVLPTPLEAHGPNFYLKFGTVLVIIFTIIELAILNVLQGQDVATILAAIVGYILGHAVSHPDSQPAKQTDNQ